MQNARLKDRVPVLKSEKPPPGSSGRVEDVCFRPVTDIQQAQQDGGMSMWRDGLSRLREALADLSSRHDRIPSDIHEQLPLTDIQKVTFYNHDELTADLICCDVEARGQTWFFHEEAEGWDEFLRYLERLPSFRQDWYEAVVHPPFAACEIVAFDRG